MKLTRLRLHNFQCFGPDSSTIDLEPITFLIGPNGAGKTAVHQALVRLFGVTTSLRRVRPSDFHFSPEEAALHSSRSGKLWVEAQFEFPETRESTGKHATIPPNFAHMRLTAADGVTQMRIRLSATMDEDGDIEEAIVFVLEVDGDDEPAKTKIVSKLDRVALQVHYVPARRDPTEHISYAANALLGRLLRSANWDAQREQIQEFTARINQTLAESDAIVAISRLLSGHWTSMHKGEYFADPHVSFDAADLEGLLRHLTVGFAPGHEKHSVDFSRLSDGQQSILYLSLVLAAQAIGRAVLDHSSTAFDAVKLRPPVFTMIAMEEPENSLSPHYLGRLVKALSTFAGNPDAQVMVATHAPSLLRRVDPKNIRYLRLDSDRRTVVKTVLMPAATDEAYKFVREAVLAFPELYFSRLVILGEGDSETIVLPRLLAAKGLSEDEVAICVAPLGGRHVNHFWRLLHGLGIPHLTLLDLDLGRYQGGWGRIRYALRQLLRFQPISSTVTEEVIAGLPSWNSGDYLPDSVSGKVWLEKLESFGVFFSSPLDLDLAMLSRFPNAYTSAGEGDDADDEPEKLDQEDAGSRDPDGSTIAAVLGKVHCEVEGYDEIEEWRYFTWYRRLFQLGSKPAAHLEALANLSDDKLALEMPESLERLLDKARAKVAKLPE